MNISQAHIAAMFAFSMWGLFPLYWKLYQNVPAWDLFGHRLLWSFICVLIILAAKNKLGALKEISKSPKTRLMLLLSALLISSNWLLYIYAVNIGRVLEASMGYFLNPLINVFMGWLLLKEKIRKTQWPAIIMAMIAIVLMGLQSDLNHFPWIALILSITFALYGLIRKLAHVGSLEGLGFETSLMIIPVMIYWFNQGTTPLTVFNMLPAWKLVVLTLSGVVTSLPLVLFAYAARNLPLSTLGFIQYLSPSLKFLCGWIIFHEVLTPERMQAFVLIWFALAYYTIESFMNSRKRIDPKLTVSE